MGLKRVHPSDIIVSAPETGAQDPPPGGLALGASRGYADVARRAASNVVARPGPSFNCVFLRMDVPWTPVFIGFHGFSEICMGSHVFYMVFIVFYMFLYVFMLYDAIIMISYDIKSYNSK